MSKNGLLIANPPPGVNAFITEVTVLPEGMDETDEDGLRYYSLTVKWRGPRTETGRGGYAVINAAGKHLSKRGNWRWEPEPHQQRHYRWETLEGALEAAHQVINDIVISGKTWAQEKAQTQNVGAGTQ